MRHPRWRRIGLAIIIAYGSWLGMMAIHELGHVLNARASGGRVLCVTIPLVGFSQTVVHPNPREHFVVWGGPLWGVAIPLIGCGLLRAALGRLPNVWRFFTGFCLVANGAYIGIGCLVAGGGDAHDLLRLGTPRGVMVAFGVVCVVSGLWCWHRTEGLSFKRRHDRVDVGEP